MVLIDSCANRVLNETTSKFLLVVVLEKKNKHQNLEVKRGDKYKTRVMSLFDDSLPVELTKQLQWGAVNWQLLKLSI